MESPKKIILIEDNTGDVKLVNFALQQIDSPPDLLHFVYGDDFLDYVKETGLDGISVILLDFNLPKLNGLDVIQRLTRDFPELKTPIIVLSSSCSPIDIRQSYALGANAFVAKPIELDDFCASIEAIVGFWCNHNLLPEE